MSQKQNFGMPQFDPSKMDPKLLMELSKMVQQLPPAQVQKMQTLMHNMMAGFDVSREMEEFEKTLPPGFREKLMTLMAGQPMPSFTSPSSGAQKADVIDIETGSSVEATANMDLHEARLTILRAVADGRIPPEEAEKLLFTA